MLNSVFGDMPDWQILKLVHLQCILFQVLKDYIYWFIHYKELQRMSHIEKGQLFNLAKNVFLWQLQYNRHLVFFFFSINLEAVDNLIKIYGFMLNWDLDASEIELIKNFENIGLVWEQFCKTELKKQQDLPNSFKSVFTVCVNSLGLLHVTFCYSRLWNSLKSLSGLYVPKFHTHFFYRSQDINLCLTGFLPLVHSVLIGYNHCIASATHKETDLERFLFIAAQMRNAQKSRETHCCSFSR